MRIAGWRSIVLPLIVLGGLLIPVGAPAQSDFYAVPSFSLTELYDDNLFSSPARREMDFITRLGPGIEAGHLSTPVTLLGRYAFDAELFARHPELNETRANQRAALEFRYRPVRRLTLTVNGTYVNTHTPGELNVETALAVGRLRARRLAVDSSVAYHVDRFTTGTIGYAFTKDMLAEGVGNRTHAVTLGVDRRITSRDTGSLGYALHQFVFDGDGTTLSHTLTVGWAHRFTPKTRVTLRAGSRFSEGSVDPEGEASIHHRLRQGELSLTYARSQATVIGEAATVATDSLTAAAAVDPVRSIHLKATSGYFRSTLETFVAKVYQVNFEAAYEVARWLLLTGSYQFSLQQGLDPATAISDPGRREIVHNIVFLKVVAAYPSALTRPVASATPGEKP